MYNKHSFDPHFFLLGGPYFGDLFNFQVKKTNQPRLLVSRTNPQVHDAMSNTKADLMLTTAPGKLTGTFLVRRRGAENPKGFVLSVIYKGKGTHHLMSVTPTGCKLNKTTLKQATKLGDIIKVLREKRKFWPVPLKNVVKVQVLNAPSAPEPKQMLPSPAAESTRPNAEQPIKKALSTSKSRAEEPPKENTAEPQPSKELKHSKIVDEANVLVASSAPVVQEEPAPVKFMANERSSVWMDEGTK
jgi:hypothetical protein